MEDFNFERLTNPISERLRQAASNLTERGCHTSNISKATEIYGPIYLKNLLERAAREEFWQRLQRDIDTEIERIGPANPSVAKALRKLHQEMKDMDNADHPPEDQI